MGLRGHRRSASQDEDNVGCVWGLMRMLYFRRDPKFLLDTKLSARHAYREINEREHSTKRSWEFDEIEEDGNTEDRTLQKPTVKNLIADELGKVKLLKKIPNDSQRRVSEMGNDVTLDGRSKQTSKPAENSRHHRDMGVPLSQSVDSEVSNDAEEYDLESVLTNMLGEIYSCHNECPHDDCKNKNELCPSLKSLIHKKVNDLNNRPRNSDHGLSQESNDGKLLNQNSLSNTMAAQSKQLKDALEILSSNKELFLKLLQKPNPNTVDNIQKQQKVKDGFEVNKIPGQTSFVEERRGSNEHRWATKEQAKESKYMFFWRKDKSNRREMPETTNGAQAVSKIVILKPNPERGIDPKANTGTRGLHQEPSKSHAPECSRKETSKFSIKEVKKRFRIVTGDSKRERNVNDTRSLISGKEKQQIDCISEINGRTVGPKDESFFYEEAKRHLSEMLKDKDGSMKHPTVQFPKSLKGILSLPHRNGSTPEDSPRGGDHHLELLPKEADVYHACNAEREECPQERSLSPDGLGHIACSTSATLVDKVTVQEGYCINEAQEGPIHVTDEPEATYIEEINKFDCCARTDNTQCIPAEQRDDAEQVS
ncbi:hypothetical protein EJB05_23477 [Eragrostis curvula]|uniref:DUF3741 domain-containing protein n=1 Tax=Eragrostis curvula TaxID=38414 RepID=A0A5J9V769_9POAL|nr:hypothetical protein EJB05_23477 [Eragrostis curvula]